MKKNLFRMTAAALVFCCAAHVQAAGDETNGHAYFTKAELPNMANILPEAPQAQPQHSSSRTYRLDGTPANNASHGILIQNNQKIVRK